jgi:transcriptional regulator with XRE-family HTH domain
MRAIPLDPPNETLTIGARLRAARQEQQLTIDQVAQMTGLTKGFISRVERDMTSPSVASLVALCQVLSLAVGSLFESTSLKIIRKNEGATINLGGTGTHERLLTPHSESRIQWVTSVVDPGGTGGGMPYSINADIDVVHVVSGSLTVRFSDTSCQLHAGDTLTFDGREPHTWSVNGESGAELMWVLSPAPWHPRSR